MTSYTVRFNGHLCAGTRVEGCEHVLLVRRQEHEAAAIFTDSTAQRARLAAARAIRFTNRIRATLREPHFEWLRGHGPEAKDDRLTRDPKATRRGKRWKICPCQT